MSNTGDRSSKQNSDHSPKPVKPSYKGNVKIF